jgi:hypothetical protein
MLIRSRHFISLSICTMLSAGSAFAASLPGGCGDDAVQYKVKTEKARALDVPAPGSSQLVVIHTLAGDDWNGQPIARIAVDGKWLGAVKGHTYFTADIAPGPHTVCVSRQTSIRAEKDNVSVSSINAQPGQPVYLDFTITRSAIDDTKSHAAGQLLGYASPDMTAKRHETVDSAALIEVKPENASAHMRGIPASVSEIK